MKKISLLIPVVAIAIGASTAFANRPCQGCSLAPQYYFDGKNYVFAGTLGTDYMCGVGSSVCTYYISGFSYVPCQQGVYSSFRFKENKQ